MGNSFARVSAAAYGFMSFAIAPLPIESASKGTTPDPQKGSNTMSPGLEKLDIMEWAIDVFSFPMYGAS